MALSVVFFPHSLPFPVNLPSSPGGVLPTTVACLRNQAGLRTDQSVWNTRNQNSMTTRHISLAI